MPLPLEELDHVPLDYVRHIDSDGAVEALEGRENAHRQHRRIAEAHGLRLAYGQELPRQRIAAFAEDLVALTMTMNRIVLSLCWFGRNCFFTSWSFGYAGNQRPWVVSQHEEGL